MQSGDVIDLSLYRKQKYPSKEEVVEHLITMAEVVDPKTKDVAESLLEMYTAGLLLVTRSANGDYLYALRKDKAESRGPGTVQDIGVTTGHDRVAKDGCDESTPDPNCK